MKSVVDFLFCTLLGIVSEAERHSCKVHTFQNLQSLENETLLKKKKRKKNRAILSMKYGLARRIHFGEKVHDFAGKTARGKNAFK